MVSLYHDDLPWTSPQSSTIAGVTTANTTTTDAHFSSPIKMTLGTPNQHTPRTKRQLDNATATPAKNDLFRNVNASPISFMERLNRISYQDTNNNNNKQTQSSSNLGDNSSSFFDLQAYQLVPNKMKVALSAAAQEPLFSRNNFFTEEEPTLPSSSPAANPGHHPSVPPTSPSQLTSSTSQAGPASPTSSIVSVATSISENIDLSLLSWPSSPNACSPTSNRYLSFGRVAHHRSNQEDNKSKYSPTVQDARLATTTHQLATELLVNPFLEPSPRHSPSSSSSSTATIAMDYLTSSSPRSVSSSPKNTSPSSSPPAAILSPQTIPLSARMRKRFPNHAKMNRKTRVRPRQIWQIKDTAASQPPPPSSSFTGETSYKTSRQKRFKLRQRRWKNKRRVQATTTTTSSYSSSSSASTTTKRKRRFSTTKERPVWLVSSLSD
ncbi:unnamed protein product [Absidia cylindrospora]